MLRLEDQDAAAAQGGWTDADEHDGLGRGGGPDGRVAVRGELGSRRSPAPKPAEPGGRAGRRARSTARSSCPPARDPAADQTLALKAAVAAARNDVRIGRPVARPAQQRDRGLAGQLAGRRPTDELVALLLEGHRAIPVLEALDQRELFSRLLPEWEPVRSKPQRNAYHRFTVDRHLWEAAANAAELRRPRRPARPARDGSAAPRHRQGISRAITPRPAW